ncbi:hypothetical protein ECG_01697 [Echinococcus granulosus]|uniref:Ovule protein n=1 Tax=Echinococcus granulosus TaxID=6210 RepID=A0A068WCN7_ECHGR|nr:hypothetical protein ECG_01697 [Echinococcus granulosus]CDS15362.1 hypothetical protein EgrG_000775700 [Echinococcus granulosus]
MHPSYSLPIPKLHYLQVGLRRGVVSVYVIAVWTRYDPKQTKMQRQSPNGATLLSFLPTYVSQTHDVAHFVFPTLLSSNSHNYPRDNALKITAIFPPPFKPTNSDSQLFIFLDLLSFLSSLCVVPSLMH